MFRGRVQDVMRFSGIPQFEWERQWRSFAGECRTDERKGRDWKWAQMKFLDDLSKKTSKDTWRERHSEEKEALREVVRAQEKERTMQGLVPCPNCGDRFRQLASHLKHCAGIRKLEEDIQETKLHTCPGCGLLRHDLNKRKRLCKGYMLTKQEQQQHNKRRAHEALVPRHRVKQKTCSAEVKAAPKVVVETSCDVDVKKESNATSDEPETTFQI